METILTIFNLEGPYLFKSHSSMKSYNSSTKVKVVSFIIHS